MQWTVFTVAIMSKCFSRNGHCRVQIQALSCWWNEWELFVFKFYVVLLLVMACLYFMRTVMPHGHSLHLFLLQTISMLRASQCFLHNMACTLWKTFLKNYFSVVNFPMLSAQYGLYCLKNIWMIWRSMGGLNKDDYAPTFVSTWSC